jgi:DnaK suppressor protein
LEAAVIDVFLKMMGMGMVQGAGKSLQSRADGSSVSRQKSGINLNATAQKQSEDKAQAASARRQEVKTPAKKSKVVNKKAAPKKAAPTATKAKPAAKPAAKKASAKPVAKKPVPAKPKAKPATMPKAAAKSVAKKAAKPAAKPASKAPAKKTAQPAGKAVKPVSKAKTPVKASSKSLSKAPAKAPAKATKTPVKIPAQPSAKPVSKPATKPVSTPPAAAKQPAKSAAAPVAAKPASPPPAPAKTKAGARIVPSYAPLPSDMSPHGGNTAAKASFTMSAPVLAPPPQVVIKKDAKLANNWKTKAAEQLSDAEVIAMPDSEYMNAKQLAFFRLKLVALKNGILSNAGETTEHLREDTSIVPDPADRATIEEEHALELRTRDRERKLLKKIEQSIASIDAEEYGYCDETGEPIGVARLIARPTATLSLEAQQRRELKQKMFGD